MKISRDMHTAASEAMGPNQPKFKQKVSQVLTGTFTIYLLEMHENTPAVPMLSNLT